MIGFLIKKTFYDLWDNLLRIILLNLGFYVCAAIPLLLPAALAFSAPLAFLALFAGLLCCGVYLAAAARCVGEISGYGVFGFADFLRNLRAALPAGLITGCLFFAAFLAITVIIPFYGSWSAKPGLFIAAALFWVFAGAALALQFYPAASVRLDANPFRAVKRCLLFFVDNTPFCVGAFFLCLVMIPLSLPAGFLAPGPAGILLLQDEALRLRLLKYRWLEENPGAEGRKIPWDVLLMDEREKTGTRTLRGFIFPWKE